MSRGLNYRQLMSRGALLKQPRIFRHAGERPAGAADSRVGAGSSGALSSVGVSILPQIGCVLSLGFLEGE